ncbi:hypothetical protein SpCBS45565_g05316 [Spizellomyces sp. 'palustris']|nr:hypothetical protein SpCBS45565_g05316 [Spizellomyces sp. 'palustris']
MSTVAVHRTLFRPLFAVRSYAPFGSQMSDNDPHVLEREKRRTLAGHVTGVLPDAPHWDEKLATDSEAIVKADRSFVGAPPEQLQYISLEILEEELIEETTADSEAQSTGKHGTVSGGDKDA